MRSQLNSNYQFALLACVLLGLPASDLAAAEKPPEVGQQAPDFSLKDLEGKTVSLKSLVAQGPVVLIVLRGFPGYQCPICTKQVAELVQNAQGFATAGAKVVLIYPGPANQLEQRAREFVQPKSLPEHFVFLTDPGFVFTKNYALRWDAAGETSYPSSFVIDRTGKVVFALVSRSHGGRAATKDLLNAIPK